MSRQHRKRSGGRGRSEPDRSQLKRLLGVLGTIAVLVLVVAIAATEGQHTPVEAQETRDPAAVAAGAELFAANCAVCHGADLQGTETGPPLLHQIYAPNHHPDEAFQRAVAGGVQPHHWNFGTMAPVPGLTRDEVSQIVQFVRSEQEGAGILRDPSH